MANGPRSWPKRISKPTRAADTDFLAIQALTFIGSDPERANRFFAVSGLAPGALRDASADPGFLAGVLDYIAGDEPLLIAFAASIGLTPEAVTLAHATRDRPDDA